MDEAHRSVVVTEGREKAGEAAVEARCGALQGGRVAALHGKRCTQCYLVSKVLIMAARHGAPPPPPGRPSNTSCIHFVYSMLSLLLAGVVLMAL